MARNFRTFKGVRPAPRTSVWLGTRLASTTIAGSGKTLLLQLSASALTLLPFTVVWTRLDVWFESDQAATSEKPQGAIGCGVISETASTLGITAIPSPVTDPEWDWFVYQGLRANFNFFDSTGFDATASNHFVIDSKAMRKVGIDEDLVMVIALGTASGAVVGIEGRTLVKLH